MASGRWARRMTGEVSKGMSHGKRNRRILMGGAAVGAAGAGGYLHHRARGQRGITSQNKGVYGY